MDIVLVFGVAEHFNIMYNSVLTAAILNNCNVFVQWSFSLHKSVVLLFSFKFFYNNLEKIYLTNTHIRNFPKNN